MHLDLQTGLVALSLLLAVATLLAIAPALRIPYPILLVIGGLMLGVVPGMPEFIRYETELNRYAAQHAQSILCLYDLTRYGAGVIVDLLRVHPIILLSGLVLENPYYLPPDELLAVQG